MTSIAFELQDARLGKGVSLVVVKRDGTTFDLAEIKMSGDASDYLVKAWQRTLDEIKGLDLVPYSPEVVVRAGEGRALSITDDLREESEVIALLLADTDLMPVGPGEVDSKRLYLYALISDTKAGRIAMVKKTNPTRRAQSGKRWALAGDELRLMSDDPWQLHPTFDLVVSEDGGYALNTFFFEQLFADAERLRAKVGEWVHAIADHLPMDADQRDLLIKRCRASPRLRRRLRSIAYRGHVGRVSIAAVGAHARAMGLTPATFIDEGKLVIDEANIEELLRLLNEDLMRGGLTGDRFNIEGKEPM